MNAESERERFKNYLRKIGSGEETGRGMTREECADAVELMLKGIPTPAQIGAFMIAHRIRRPEPQELAGMVDTYLKLGPNLKSIKERSKPICFGMPFDGRNRTAPIYPLTTLVLLDIGQPIVLHGAGRIPVKYGISTMELFKIIGLNLQGLTLNQVQDGFSKHGLALIYQPDHFSIAEELISYREEIGKRPPIASMELLWTAHKGDHLLVTGYVHEPTEDRHLTTLKILKEKAVITLKGLEGGVDIPMNRISKITKIKNDIRKEIFLDPSTVNYRKKDEQWKDEETWKAHSINALNGEGPLSKAVIWNAGVYLWLADKTNTIEDGIKKAQTSLLSGSAKTTLQKLIRWREKIK